MGGRWILAALALTAGCGGGSQSGAGGASVAGDDGSVSGLDDSGAPLPPVSDANLGNCTVSLMTYGVIDAEYDAALDRIVTVSAYPNRLHILDGVAGTETTVDLPRIPAAVSVGPDGLTAAVGHDGFVSLVDLMAAKVSKTVPVFSDVSDIALGNGYAYVLPKTDQWVQVHSVDLTAGVDRTMPNQSTVYAGAVGVLQAGLGALYIAVQGSPSGVQRYNLVNGIATNGAGGSPACLAIWPGADQTRIYTACGTAVTTSNQSDDMKILGTMFNATTDDANFISQGGTSVYVIRHNASSQTGSEDGKVEVYSATTFALTSTMQLPCIHTATRDVRSHGRFVFPTKAGNRVVVLVQADPGSSIAGNWGIAVL